MWCGVVCRMVLCCVMWCVVWGSQGMRGGWGL
jgi:hypothetical protein